MADSSETGAHAMLQQWRATYSESAQAATWLTAHQWRYGPDVARATALDVRRKLDLQPQDRILEIGAGSGAFLAAVAHEKQQAIGFDACGQQVMASRRFGVDAARIKLGVADAIDIPAADDSFDKVLCYSIIHYFPDDVYLRQAIREMLRICRPEGVILIGDVAGVMERTRKFLLAAHCPKVIADAAIWSCLPVRQAVRHCQGRRPREGRSYRRPVLARILRELPCRYEFLEQSIPGRRASKSRFDIRLTKLKNAPPEASRGRSKLPLSSRMGPSTRVSLCGVEIDPITMPQAVARVEGALDSGRSFAIGVINVAKLVNLQKDRLLRQSIIDSDLVLADGAPLVWLSRLKGTPLPERVAGIDLMFELFALANRRGLRVFLLGAKKTTLEGVMEVTRHQYPRMKIVGCRDGYFAAEQEREIAESIRNDSPHMLFVAMTSPKKEIFMNRWGSTMNVPICHGVGGSFDVMAGVTRRAPRWMQRTGLEWFYRVMQEPRRMWKRYLVTNTAFVFLAAQDLLRRTKGKAP